MPSKSSTTQSQSLDTIVAAVLAALQGEQAEAETPRAKPATRSSGKATTRKPAARKVTVPVKRTISDPDRHASNKQAWLLSSVLFARVYGEALPNPLTMGDVQAILDDPDNAVANEIRAAAYKR